MVEVKTSALIGAALDWAVWLVDRGEPGYPCKTYKHIYMGEGRYWAPSNDWSQGGPLIEKYRIEFSINEDTYEVGASLLAWRSFGKSHRTRWSKGSSHLIAACRAIVAAKLGDTVQVPAELLSNG